MAPPLSTGKSKYLAIKEGSLEEIEPIWKT
jgi:hypothetical protein